MEVQDGLPLRLVAGIKQAAGFRLVLGAQTSLLAGGAVLDVKDFPAPEHRVFCFHTVIALNQSTSPGATAFANARCGKVSADFLSVLASCPATHRFTDISADSGLPSCQETLYLRGF